jgi:hypothetical protein
LKISPFRYLGGKFVKSQHCLVLRYSEGRLPAICFAY